MANTNETISENIEKEILSQEDQVSKNGGINVTLEDFLSSTTKTIHNKSIIKEDKNNNLIYTDDAKNNFNNFKIEESINLDIDNRVNNNELLISNSYDKLKSDKNINFVQSKDIDTNNISQNRTIDESKIVNSDLSYDASNILKDIETRYESDLNIETKQTNTNSETTTVDTQSTYDVEKISNTNIILEDIELTSNNEVQTKEETAKTEESSEVIESQEEPTETKTEVVFTKDDIKIEKQIDSVKEKNPNNGKGNGDQDAPGNSLEHNNAENAIDDTYKLSDNIEFNIENIIVEQKEIPKEEPNQKIFIDEIMNMSENNSSFDKLSNKKESISNNHNNESEKEFIDKGLFSGFEEIQRLAETHIHVD